MTTQERKDKVAELRKYHEQVLSTLGEKSFYYPKMVIKRASGDVIGLFTSEVDNGQDMFTEFIDRSWNPSDPERTLWRIKYNPFYKDEYETEGFGDAVRYLYPVAELQKVTITRGAVQEHKLKELADSPIDSMTIRDLAAILWKKPVSRKSWLNDLVEE